jgi:two-component system phosphate regulon sensor histidine kinase PhoR
MARTHLLLAATALAINVALAVVWLAWPELATTSWPVRWGALCTVLAPTIGAGFVIVRYLGHEQRKVVRHLELLSRHDYRRGGAVAPDLPALQRQGPWANVCQQVSQTLASLATELQEAEHGRAALEVRLRRAADRCERAEEILHSLAEPVIAVDEFDELLLANRSAEQLFEIDLQGGERRTLAAVRCQALVDLLSETSRRKLPTSRTGEVELTDRSGEIRCFKVATSSLGHDAGAQGNGHHGLHGAVAVLQDITHQKGAHKRHAEFVSAASHEMKAPLAGIRAYVEMLLDGDAPDEKTREEFLNVISGQANRLQRLVENLLNLARIEAGVVQVEKTHYSLNELLSEAVELMRPQAVEKQIDLQADLSPMYLGVLVDRDLLLQAAINLLSNGIKYTPAGGRVTLRSRLCDEAIQFAVEDTGVGLSPEDCNRVFQKFYRVAKDRDMASGTGLGLPLVKSIVEEVLGGAISVESTLGAGSAFTVTLPSAGQLRHPTPRGRSLQETAT